MTTIEALSRPITAAAPDSAGSAASASGGAATSSAGKSTAMALATLLALASGGALGYTQWWLPRQEAQQVAQVKYEHCLKEVKVYRGKHSYEDRLAQCTKFLNS